jgi:hypothetical protein
MPAFDAGAAVESLDWDFSTSKIRDLAKAKGTVPEPTDAAIGRFLDGLKALYTQVQSLGVGQLPTDAAPEEMLAALSSLTGDKFVTFMADTAELFATLCSSQPSKDELLLLPLRARIKFYAWIQSEVVNPEAGTGAGTAVVRSLPSAAAG